MRGETIRRLRAALDPEARGLLGMEYLRRGFYADGWALYESRLEMPGHMAASLPTDAPKWDGVTPFGAKGLLLWHEQGLGDTILLLRYVPLVVKFGGRIILAVEAPLRRLAASVSDAPTIIAPGDTFEDVAFQASLYSLPWLLRTRLATIPNAVPYLAPPAESISRWRDRLGVASRPRIGLVCSGSPINVEDHARSIPLRLFAPLLQIEGAEFHLLQNHLRETDRPALDAMPDLQVHCNRLTDLAEVAALAAGMDLVISVCTAGAHVAGALGRPTWIALPHHAYHIWLQDRDDSPWHPSARLFRQIFPGDWPGTIERLARALRTFVHNWRA